MAPLTLLDAEFEATFALLARDLRVVRGPRLLRAGFRAWNRPHASARELVLLSGYDDWCQAAREEHGDCLNVVQERPLGGEEKHALALALGLESAGIWDAARITLAQATRPEVVQAALTLALASYLTLLVLPDPITKAIAVSLTVYLIAYLGWDVLWGIVLGWQALSEEVAEAFTFDELRAAGERFGRVLGVRGGRGCS